MQLINHTDTMVITMVAKREVFYENNEGIGI